MPVRRWAIWHTKHDGTIEGQISPENLHVTWNKGENGPHEITYDVPAYYPGFDVARINPYNEDFALVLDDVPIMKGIVTSVSLESEQDWASIAGKDWLHYLERRFFPFDPLNPNYYRVGDPPRGLAFEADPFHPVEVRDIVLMLLNMTLARSNSLPIVWWEDPPKPPGYYIPVPPPGSGISYDALTPLGSWWHNNPPVDVGLPPTGVSIPYSIDLGDTETILSKIQSLSQMDPGLFDFWIDMDKVFHMAVPRHYDIRVLGDPTLAHWYFKDSDSGLLNVKWTNNGPEGTHLFGHGSETVRYITTTNGHVDDVSDENVNVGLNMDDPVNQNVYRRLDADADFGDVPGRSRVNALTQGKFMQTNNPAFEVTIEIYPDAVPNLFTGQIYPGCAIWLDYEHPAYHINSAYEVVSMEVEVNTEAEEMVTLNLNQVVPPYQDPLWTKPWHVPPHDVVLDYPPLRISPAGVYAGSTPKIVPE